MPTLTSAEREQDGGKKQQTSVVKQGTASSPAVGGSHYNGTFCDETQTHVKV